MIEFTLKSKTLIQLKTIKNFSIMLKLLNLGNRKLFHVYKIR